MITLFTTLKPFRSPLVTTIQRNALKSWKNIRPHCEVILFGNDEGVAQIATELGFRHISDVELNARGLPLIRSLFGLAQQHATFTTLCYLNGDIILNDQFLQVLPPLAQRFPQGFLGVGRRWDIDVPTIDFTSPGWQQALEDIRRSTGILHGPSGIDFFLFTKGVYQDIPPLVVGRAGWDNWMIYSARVRHIPVIDLTLATKILHQEHDLPQQRATAARFVDESAKLNIAYAGGYGNLLTIRDSNWCMDSVRIRRNWRGVVSLFPLWRWALALYRRLQKL